MNAKDKRSEIIQDFVSAFIDTNPNSDMLGHRKGNPSFGDALDRLYSMRQYGDRNKKWKEGLRECRAVVVQAMSILSERVLGRGSSDVAINIRPNDLTINGQEEFDKLMVWAVLQGSTYLYIANNCR